jgi:LPXTG-motif cell wall-anchored protein
LGRGFKLKDILAERLKTFICVAVVLAMLSTSFVIVAGSALAVDRSNSGNDSDLGAGAVPGAPLNLVADRGPGYVWLWWDHPASNGDDLIKRYYIYRGESSGGQGATPIDWTYVGNTSYYGTDMGGLNFYNDTSVVLETTYYYKLKASSDAGNSSFSNEVSAKPSLTGSTPDAPAVVGVNQVYQAQINWTEPSNSGSTPVRFYFVYRDPGIFTTLIEDWYRETGYVDEVGFFTVIGEDYNYSVRAVNSYGQGSPGWDDVRIGGTGTTPGAPENLTAIGLNNSAFLAWERPANPSAWGFDSYDVYRSTTEGGAYTIVGNETTVSFFGYYGLFFDEGLTNGVKYYYKVTSVNWSGPQSGFSNIANATPVAYSIPFEVATLDAYPGDGKVLLIWDTAHNETESATSYNIYRSESPGTETLLINVGSVNHYLDYDVTNGNTYYYKVEPLIDTMAGTTSPEASATPNTGNPPAAPTGLVATPSPDGVELYLPPSTPNSILIGYEVYRGDSSGTQDTTAIDVVEDIDFDGGIDWTDDTALPDVNYFYTVKLLNMYGLSDASNEATSFASPTGDFPDPVTDLSATGGSGKITLQWSSPTYQGTANLLTYNLLRNDTDGTWDTVGYYIRAEVGPIEFVDDIYVLPGVTYSYRVEVSNAYGDALELSNIDTASATGSTSAPSAPRNPDTQAGNGYVILTWDAPSSAGSSAITSYDVYRATSSGGYGTVLGTVNAGTLTYNDTTAVPGTPYFYIVKAVNTAGSSPASSEVTATATSAGTAPSAPQNLSGAGHNGYVILTWQAPSSAGSSAITRYDVYRGLSAGSIGTTSIGNVAAGILTFNDTTVTNGIPYFYVVKAMSTVGSSPASNTAQATPSATGVAPGVPTALTATGNPGSITLTWTEPAGGNVEKYLVFRGTTAGGEGSTPIDEVIGSTSYLDDSVTVGTPYYYMVKANNSYGTSGSSNEANATATALMAPGAPKNLVATPGSGKVTLTWTAPASDGGSPILNYQVYRTPEGGSVEMIKSVGASTLTYVDESGTAGTNYTYTVKAVNAIGTGPSSSAVTTSPEENGNGGSDNTMWYIIGGGVAVAAIAGLGYFFLKKKK